jgi:hypothetical protein
MPQISAWMDTAITAAKDSDEGTMARIKGEVADFVKPFPIPGWLV